MRSRTYRDYILKTQLILRLSKTDVYLVTFFFFEIISKANQQPSLPRSIFYNEDVQEREYFRFHNHPVIDGEKANVSSVIT